MDLTHGLVGNLAALLGLSPLEVEMSLGGPAMEVPPVARTQMAQEDVGEYVAAVARAKESAAFRSADDGATPMFMVLLQGRYL